MAKHRRSRRVTEVRAASISSMRGLEMEAATYLITNMGNSDRGAVLGQVGTYPFQFPLRRHAL